MTKLGIIHTLVFFLWRKYTGRPISEDDLQEWVHERNYCCDPLCPFIYTERGARFK